MQRKLNSRRRDAAVALTPSQRATRRQIRLGLAVVAVVLLTLVTAAVVYLEPPGRKTLTFLTTDAAALNGGEDVRVAGVSVGKVTSLAFDTDVVEVTAELDDSTFVGSESEVEVRLLTPVGGYYVVVVPLGDDALGDESIPLERVRMPYSISDVLQEAPPVTDNVDGTTVDADIQQLASGLSHNWTSVGSMIDGLDAVATIMADQREQIQTILSMTNEYADVFNQSREFLFAFLQKVETVIATYYTYRDGFNQTYHLFGDVLMRLVPLEQFYLDHKLDVRAAVDQAQTAIDGFMATAGPTIDQLTALRDQITQWLTPEGIAEVGGGQILASQLCVPVPGRTC